MRSVTVCVATYRRPTLLDHCIRGIVEQAGMPISFSIVVVDNDPGRSAEAVVRDWRARSSVELVYGTAQPPNISLARNRAVELADGDLIAFIDDDEVPEPRWLAELTATYLAMSVDGVLGPVVPAFEGTPPRWLAKSGLCTRREFPTGTQLHSVRDMRTGNVLFGRHMFMADPAPFDPAYGRSGGEDTEFFARKCRDGYTFGWCNSARVLEWVPAERQTLRFYVRRAFVLGATAAAREGLVSVATLKSVTALVVYSALLPFSWVLGGHVFVSMFVKHCNHAAKLLAYAGFRPISRRREAG